MTLLIVLNILYALGYPLGKLALDDSQPLFLISLRMLLGGLLLLAWELGVKKKKISFSKKSFMSICISGVLGMYLVNVFSYWGLATISATRAAFVENLGPIVAAFLEWLIFKDKFTFVEWFGIIIATFGTMQIVASPGANILATGLSSIQMGDIFIMLSDIVGVYSFILIRKIASEEDFNPILTNGIAMLIGGIFALGHSLLTETWSPIPTTNVASMIINTILMLIIYNILCDNLYNFLATEYTVTTLMLSGFTVPLFTAAFDWLFFGLKIPHVFWISALFIITGMFCCMKKTKTS